MLRLRVSEEEEEEETEVVGTLAYSWTIQRLNVHAEGDSQGLMLQCVVCLHRSNKAAASLHHLFITFLKLTIGFQMEAIFLLTPFPLLSNNRNS